MTNSADPDQWASSEGSTQFAKTRHVMFSKRKVKQPRYEIPRIGFLYIHNTVLLSSNHFQATKDKPFHECLFQSIFKVCI